MTDRTRRLFTRVNPPTRAALIPARSTGWPWPSRFSGLPGSRRYSVVKFKSERDISAGRRTEVTLDSWEAHMGIRRIVMTVLASLAAVTLAGSAHATTRLAGPTAGATTRIVLEAGHFHTCFLVGDGAVRCWGENTRGQIGDGTTTNRREAVVVPGLNNVVAVTGGLRHTCALLTDATVRCWGQNSSGQLGDGTTTERHSPVAVSGLTDVVMVNAGFNHTCALRSDGTVRCWGFNSAGQLGDSSTTRRLTPVTVSGLTEAVAIDTGGVSSCAIRADGSARCWGSNFRGALGDGTLTNRLVPVAVSGLSNVALITLGPQGHHACAVLADGTPRCWGRNDFGQVGDGTTVDRLTPVQVGLSGVTAITTGHEVTCALRGDGTVSCWGRNRFGKLGVGSTIESSAVPLGVGLTTVTSISSGQEHVCAIRAGGRAFCWGRNVDGAVGDGTSTNRFTPSQVVGVTGSINALSVGAASLHTCGVRSDGSGTCWGANTSGQVGDGTSGNVRPNPTGVSNLNDAVAVAPGQVHTCALRADGTVRCWGSNTFGQLGDNTTTARVTPVLVSGLTNATAIGAGQAHSCALRADGTVRCWGSNSFGQLGDGSTSQRTAPVQVSGLTSAVALAVGSIHSCALRADGSARCWGSNGTGQLGDGSAVQFRTTPVTVTGLTRATALAAGSIHTCATRVDGSGRCWGANDAGQLGDGTTLQRSTPVPVSGLSRAIAVVAAEEHSCALRNDATVRCWGGNDAGQLGDGTTTQRTAPVQVTGLTTATGIAASNHGIYTCALKVNGAPACWGDNDGGQLGDGTFTGRLTPVQVPSFAANILVDLELRHDAKAAKGTVLVNCPDGLKLQIELRLTQGSVSGVVHRNANCEGALTEYPVSVPLRGRQTFTVGPADAELTAHVREGGTIVETLQWTRDVDLEFAP